LEAFRSIGADDRRARLGRHHPSGWGSSRRIARQGVAGGDSPHGSHATRCRWPTSYCRAAPARPRQLTEPIEP